MSVEEKPLLKTRVGQDEKRLKGVFKSMFLDKLNHKPSNKNTSLLDSLKWKTFGLYEDLRYYYLGLPRLIFSWKPGRAFSLYQFFEDNVKRYPNRAAFIFKEKRYSWRESEKEVLKYAHIIEDVGLKKGDCFALLMDNSAHYLFILLAAMKCGVVPALINTTVKGKGLMHVIDIVEAKRVFIGASHLEKYEEAFKDKINKELVFVSEDTKNVPQEYQNLDALATKTTPLKTEPVLLKDLALYMYTSGTTGLPKAACITHNRAIRTSYFGQFFGFNFNKHDVFYVVLPLYHATGLTFSWAAALRAGATTVIKEKFSVGEFWDDIHRYQVTAFSYVGELCRYLLHAKKHPKEQHHKLRVISGNGLRPDIWQTFQSRFKIPKIRELYGATEGTTAFVNRAGREGMIGRHRSADKIIRCHLDTGEPILNKDGFCDVVSEGQTGLYISKISKLGAFDGYKNQEASQKKVLLDVFEKGDLYFNSGDLLTLHKNQWLSFADRVGDTYRWKGENVSTMEVAAIVNQISGVLDSNVYGVQVGEVSGRAGMVSLLASDAFDLKVFAIEIDKHLNAFQRPYFLRITKKLQVTGTFKHQKEALKKLGFDPKNFDDPIYFYQEGSYVEVSPTLYAQIQSGSLHF